MLKKKGADVFSSICREKFFSNDQIFLHYKKLSKVNMPILVHVMPFLSGYSGQNYNWPTEILQNSPKLKILLPSKKTQKTLNMEKKFSKNTRIDLK